MPVEIVSVFKNLSVDIQLIFFIFYNSKISYLKTYQLIFNFFKDIPSAVTSPFKNLSVDIQ